MNPTGSAPAGERGRRADANHDWLRRARRLSERLGASAWFSYSTIAFVQLHVMWGIWNSPTLGSGDTSHYFIAAEYFAEFGRIRNIVMSPLYSTLYGAVLAATGDPYTATWLHRIVIVLAASLAALALFRQLLPPSVAWGLAAWWSLSPIIFNTLYEVHLFSAVPVLCACIIAAAVQSPWGRGCALGILAGSGLLVRNELVAATAVFAAGCAFWEWFFATRSTKASTYFLVYAVPLGAATLVVLLFYAGVPKDFDMDRRMDNRHRANMAQVYAFGHQQRNPEWTNNPWIDYHGLMTEHFGNARPSIGEMLRTNPRATLEHFLWNLRLTPAGLQLLLFSAVSGELNPDYPVPPMHSTRALVLSLIVFALWLGGGFKLFTGWSIWWRDWIRPRAPGWLALLAVSSMAPLIILSQRPRPSYLFGLAAFLMAFTGLCVVVIVDSRRWMATIRPWWPAAALAAVIALPQFYPDAPTTRAELFTHVDRLRPYRELLSRPGEKLYSLQWGSVLPNYACDGRCTGGPVPTLSLAEQDIQTYLDANGFSALYVDEPLLQALEASQDGIARPFVDFVPSPWRVLHFEDGVTGRWRLYHRNKTT